jgi:hypothetical protein
MIPISTTPTPAAVDDARNLLACVLDADLAREPLLTIGEAYDHLEESHSGLWSPPHSARVANPAEALGRAHSLLADTLDQRQHALDPIELALAIRATATALALLRPGGDVA